MTSEELYKYDLMGYLLLDNAIEPGTLARLNARLDEWEQEALRILEKEKPSNPLVMFDDILNRDESFLCLVNNPRVLPYVNEMIERPRLKSTWATFKWKGGGTDWHSNHTPTNTCNFYHYNGRIRHNLFQVFYAMKDIGPGEGALEVIPGTHKANYPLPPKETLQDLKVEIPMKAGSVLLFTHDMYHGSINLSDKVRRTVIFTYCPSVIANSYVGDTLYDKLFEKAPEGGWLKYLLRRPHGYLETYPQPIGRPYETG